MLRRPVGPHNRDEEVSKWHCWPHESVAAKLAPYHQGLACNRAARAVPRVWARPKFTLADGRGTPRMAETDPHLRIGRGAGRKNEFQPAVTL